MSGEVVRTAGTAAALPGLIAAAAAAAQLDAPDLAAQLAQIQDFAVGWVSAAPDRRRTDGTSDEVRAACLAAAEPAVPLALRSLAHADPAVRTRAALLLAGLHAHGKRHDALRRVRDALTTERDPAARATLVIALTSLLPMSDSRTLRELAASAAELPVVRLVAAIGCASRGQLTDDAVAMLGDACLDPGLAASYARLPAGTDDLSGQIGWLLAHAKVSLARAVPQLVAAIAREAHWRSGGVVAAAVGALFAVKGSPTTLLPAQRQLLEVMVRNEALWAVRPGVLLEVYGLPTTRHELAAYIGVEL